MKNLIQQLHKSMQNMHFSAMQNTRFSNVLTPSVLVLFLFLLGVGNVWGGTKDVFIDLNEAPSWYTKPEINHGTGKNYSITVASATSIDKIYKATIPDDHAWEVCRDGGNNKVGWTDDASLNKVRVYNTGAGGKATQIVGIVEGGYIYFDNSVSKFTGHIYFVIGYDYDFWEDISKKYSKVYEMSNVDNTSSLFYVNVPDKWADATYYAIVASSSTISNGEDCNGRGSSSLPSMGNNGYTAAYTGPYNLTGSSYLITTASAGNNQAITITYYSGSGSLNEVNATQSAKKRDTGTTYSTFSGSWPATLKLTGTHLSDNGETDRSTITSTASTDGDAEKTYGAVKSGLITHTYENLNSDYYFEGWGTGSTPSYTSSPYDYNITAATTVYAFFSKKYTLTYDVKGTAGTSTLSVTEVSDFSGTKTSGSSIPTGHSITLTAAPATGYRLTSEQAWYSDAACTSSLNNETNTTYTITSLDADRAVYAKFEAIPYTITYNLNGGTNHEDNPASYNIETAITLQTPTYPGHTFIGWYANSTCTGDAVTSIPLGSTGNKEYWAKWEENENHFTAKSGNNWSTTANWSAGVPTIDDIVYIEEPVVVDITNARAYQVIIDQSSSNTGKITINAGKELVVATTLTKTPGSTTDPEDLVFLSDASHGLGALVTGTLSANQATVNFYTKSHGTSGSSASVAQYLGTPFSDATVLSDFYNSWVYETYYSSALGNLAWRRVEGSLNSFQGYCVISADAEGHSYEMQGTLATDNNKVVSLFNSADDTDKDTISFLYQNENMFANSWMAPIKISNFTTSQFETASAYATIYIFNTGSKDDYDKYKDNVGGTNPGQYNIYPINAAEDAIIPSMQAFSVFSKGYTGPAGNLTLDYTQLVYNPALTGTVPGPNKAPRRNNMIADEAGKMYVHVIGESGYRDRVYLWQHEDFADGFENGWDGHKLFGESIAPQLYAQTPDGKMAVNCAPEFDGTILGFTKGSLDNTYTFRFAPQTDEVLYLNDMRTQTSTLINAENTYTFTAGEDDSARFLISRTPYPKMPTGVSDTQASSSKARKIFINGQLYVLNGNALFDITGKRVNVQ